MLSDNLPFIIKQALAYRRRSRVNFMLSKVTVGKNMKVIDIGCGINGRSFADYVPNDWEITGVDKITDEQVHHNHPKFYYIQRDAQDLSCFGNYEFDLAVSVGMLEHITEESVFHRVVSEIRRVAKQYIVVVPYKYCWIEPHYGIPFFPVLPYSLKLYFVRIFNLSNHREAIKSDPEYINKNYRWLSNAQYRHEFPDSKIYILPTLEMIAIVRNTIRFNKMYNNTT